MTRDTARQQSTEQVAQRNAIRPFHVTVPEAELNRVAQAHQIAHLQWVVV